MSSCEIILSGVVPLTLGSRPWPSKEGMTLGALTGEGFRDQLPCLLELCIESELSPTVSCSGPNWCNTALFGVEHGWFQTLPLVCKHQKGRPMI